MIRVVIQHSPSLFSMALVDEVDLTPTFAYDDQTYYRAETHDHYVLYRAAISGWGAAAPNPNDARPVFDPRQR